MRNTGLEEAQVGIKMFGRNVNKLRYTDNTTLMAENDTDIDIEVAQLCLTLATPWIAAYQAPPSMEFSRQEHWSGLPLPSPIYTLLCIKQMNNKDLLYGMEN